MFLGGIFECKGLIQGWKDGYFKAGMGKNESDSRNKWYEVRDHFQIRQIIMEEVFWDILANIKLL